MAVLLKGMMGIMQEDFNEKLTIVLPHPSPLNIKWFKDHPGFMKKRILEVRKIINAVLNENIE